MFTITVHTALTTAVIICLMYSGIYRSQKWSSTNIRSHAHAPVLLLWNNTPLAQLWKPTIWAHQSHVTWACRKFYKFSCLRLPHKEVLKFVLLLELLLNFVNVQMLDRYVTVCCPMKISSEGSFTLMRRSVGHVGSNRPHTTIWGLLYILKYC